MNITYIFKQDPERSHLKSWLKYHYPTPRLVDVKEIVAAPSKRTEKYSSLIGTSFDYLFRFKIESINKKKKVIKREKWVAESAFEMLPDIKTIRENYSLLQWHSKLRHTHDPLFGKSQKEALKFIEYIKRTLELAKHNYANFIIGGILTNEIVESCIFLGKLEVYRRCFKLPEDITKRPSKYVIEEIKQLYCITNWSKFKAKTHCILNPSLGNSKTVACGDADLILDETLIDLKTSKYFELKREVLNQLLGYYFLTLVNPKFENNKVEIKKIGIYLARFNHLIEISICDFHDMEMLPKQKRDFFRLVKNPSLKLI